jgi:hypothetical protein
MKCHSAGNEAGLSATSITTNASVKDFYVVIVGSNVSMVVQHSLLIAGAITMNITKQNMEIALVITTTFSSCAQASRISLLTKSMIFFFRQTC